QSTTQWAPGTQFGLALLDPTGAVVATVLVMCPQSGACGVDTPIGTLYLQSQPLYTMYVLVDGGNIEVGVGGGTIEVASPQPAVTPALIATPDIQVSFIDAMAAGP